MKYYLDTEFIERPCTIDLISLAIVSEDGRQLYCESSDFDESQASDWVKENVIKQLWSRRKTDPFKTWGRAGLDVGGKMQLWEMSREVRFFVGTDPDPVFYGYFCDYDWVAFCWLFGTMMELPHGFPMYCRDIKQTADEIGFSDWPKQAEDEHNALADALWTKQAQEAITLFVKETPKQ